MTNSMARLGQVVCFAGLMACGPSALELRVSSERDELQKDLAEQRQYNADLKQRIQIVDARNKVLIDLVKGLTVSAEHGAGSDTSQVLQPAHSSLRALDKDLEALLASVQHSREDLDAERAQRAVLAQELDQAKQTIESSRAEEASVNARAQSLRDLLGRLNSLVESGALQVRLMRNRLLLQLPETALFESGDANITKPGKSVLDQVAEVLNSAGEREFQIGGHTDSTPPHAGRFRNNWQLSSVRALNVMLYLIDRGVPKARLSAAAYADTQPFADDATPDGRKTNRRIEIVLLPNLDELPDISALNELLNQPKPVAAPSADPNTTPEAPTPGPTASTPPAAAPAPTLSITPVAPPPPASQTPAPTAVPAQSQTPPATPTPHPAPATH
jgi:chemotaxis protein MotB